MMRRALVYGLAEAGAAVVRALVARGVEVVLADDRPGEAQYALAAEVGAELHVEPDATTIARLVQGCDLVVPAPGVPERHRVVAVALDTGVPLRSELDLAAEWEAQRPGGPRPFLAVTGTDGKTTTVHWLAEVVRACGLRAVVAGNVDPPLVAALDADVDVFVVECSSFRLRWLTRFAPRVGAWLNLAPDHLDWHTDMAAYAAAKANLWAHQGRDDVAVGNLDDPIVAAHLATAPSRRVTFSAAGDPAATYRRDGADLVGPLGRLVAVDELRRAFPHDVANALAVAATALEAGLPLDGVRAGLRSFAALPHRIALVGTSDDGVAWYDDSKATSPHAALSAIRAFERIVLLAGGRNKGLDLADLASEPARMAWVIALGESADAVEAAFAGVCPTLRASSMAEAVTLARRVATTGDTVLLSPGCASWDWYPTGGYAARGDDFAAEVRRQVLHGQASGSGATDPPLRDGGER